MSLVLRSLCGVRYEYGTGSKIIFVSIFFKNLNREAMCNSVTVCVSMHSSGYFTIIIVIVVVAVVNNNNNNNNKGK